MKNLDIINIDKQGQCLVNYPCNNCNTQCKYYQLLQPCINKGQDEKENENERTIEKHEEGNQLHPH